MYNRFSVEEEEGVTRRKKEKVALKKVGRPTKKKKNEKARRKRTETSPPFIMRCVLLWHFPTLFYTHSHTYVVQHTYIYIYLTLFIYTNTGTTPNMVVRKLPAAGELEREKRKRLRIRVVGWWWFTAQSLISIVSFIKTSNGQHISCRYFIVISPSTCLWWPNDRIPMTNRNRLGQRRFSDLVCMYNGG